MVPDENSMNDPLCNSAIGSMVSLDYVTPDTERTAFFSSPENRCLPVSTLNPEEREFVVDS